MEKFTFETPQTLEEIANLCEGSVANSFASHKITSVVEVNKKASYGDLCVLQTRDELKVLELSNAGACLVTRELKHSIPVGIIPVVVESPLGAWKKLAQIAG